MHINILGIRGIPAAHGGFETFAAQLAPWLVARGHTVSVYCQEETGEAGPWIDTWQGIERVHFRPKRGGAAGTMEFDLACVRHVLDRPGIDLVLGYNTAVFNILERLKGRRIMMNMDGIEWKRAKWSLLAKTWFFLNEVAGANLCHVPIADHPEIARHVRARSFRKPVMIPYGADVIEAADAAHITDLGLVPDRYLVSIARIEPENSILEMVQAFGGVETDAKCVILGKFIEGNAYHAAVKAAAGPNVVFPGAIYDQEIVAALRFHARAYLHGHQVGGTNPSLVEALGAGNAVIGHDNRFNRWVAGDAQYYFADIAEAQGQMQLVFQDDERLQVARLAARARHNEAFQWEDILSQYETALLALDQSRKR
jgi:glycosyltransferase involved in cell wall biosynthesis